MDSPGSRALAAALLLAACARPELGSFVAPDVTTPTIRIGVVPGAATLTVGGGGPLVLRSPDGVEYAELPPSVTATVTAGAQSLRVRLSGMTLNPGPALELVAPDSGGPVRVNGRDYRGSFLLSARAGGVSAVNVVDVEEYLVGVVGAELGRRTENELEGIRAQAVISRSIALKALGRWRARGFDLLATVADQAYFGVGAENPLAIQAVRDTRGEALTWQGQLIDGFFHSTCGGRTAEGTEVFAAASRPYLRSIRDEDESGRAWCAGSPRFRWRESWTGEALARTLRETLPPAGASAELAGSVLDLSVASRTATGRVAQLEIRGPSGRITVTGPGSRLVLRMADGNILRSATFNLQVSRSGGRIVQLSADGAGAGHGVGMCQWGALGRARAGHAYQDILQAYFPATSVIRTY